MACGGGRLCIFLEMKPLLRIRPTKNEDNGTEKTQAASRICQSYRLKNETSWGLAYWPGVISDYVAVDVGHAKDMLHINSNT